MTHKQSEAIKLIDQGQSVETAAVSVGISTTEIRNALAERDRRKGNHQTREAS